MECFVSTEVPFRHRGPDRSAATVYCGIRADFVQFNLNQIALTLVMESAGGVGPR